MRWCLSFPFLAPVFSGPWVLDNLINPLYIMASPVVPGWVSPVLTGHMLPTWPVCFLTCPLLISSTPCYSHVHIYEEINILLTHHSKYWLIERGHLWTVFPLSKGIILSYGKFQAPRQADWEIMFACLSVAFECACDCMFEEGIAARDIFS